MLATTTHHGIANRVVNVPRRFAGWIGIGNMLSLVMLDLEFRMSHVMTRSPALASELHQSLHSLIVGTCPTYFLDQRVELGTVWAVRQPALQSFKYRVGLGLATAIEQPSCFANGLTRVPAGAGVRVRCIFLFAKGASHINIVKVAADFANRAGDEGARLGIIFHNMQTERAQHDNADREKPDPDDQP